jgi:hypothetical protein
MAAGNVGNQPPLPGQAQPKLRAVGQFDLGVIAACADALDRRARDDRLAIAAAGDQKQIVLLTLLEELCREAARMRPAQDRIIDLRTPCVGAPRVIALMKVWAAAVAPVADEPGPPHPTGRMAAAKSAPITMRLPRSLSTIDRNAICPRARRVARRQPPCSLISL